MQVHLEETLGSCVSLSVFTGLLLLVAKRQDARTGQEIFFFLSMRVFDKNISCVEASENNAGFCQKSYFPAILPEAFCQNKNL